jgi:hypothetical protein
MTDPLDSLLDPLPPLRPTAGDARLRRQLDGVTVEAVCGGRAPVDATAAQACLAGLWLGHGFLDESHRISQEIDTPEGSWWHGIMHRCEGDFSNAAYWFRRVGDHPLLRELAAHLHRHVGPLPGAAALPWLTAADRFDPFRFTDLCAAVVAGRSPHEALVEAAARCEWRRLFDHCRRLATGATP